MTAPPTMPSSNPPPISRAKDRRKVSGVCVPVPPLAMSSISVIVTKIAIGSLAPDSSSRTERTRSRSLIPPTRSRKNTAAASVEPITEASRKDCSQGKPKTSFAATPTRPVVSSTPIVARTTAGSAAWREDETRVPKPESNRMMASARLPRK